MGEPQIPPNAKALLVWNSPTETDFALLPDQSLSAERGSAWLRESTDDKNVIPILSPEDHEALPQLPAPPLCLGRTQPIGRGIHLELRFQRALEGAETELVERLFSLASHALGEGRIEHGERTIRWRLELREGVDTQLLRGHSYWLVEQLARLLPVEGADVLGAPVDRSSRLPPWLAPVAIMVGAGVAGSVLEGGAAARTAALIWAFGPLVATFLLRRRIGEAGRTLAWSAATLHALLQLAGAYVFAQPQQIWPLPEDLSQIVTYQQTLVGNLEKVLFASRIAGLLWALAFVASVRMGDRSRM